MAKEKKSVLLYCDIFHTIKELSNEEAGRLFKHYLMYINDMNPTADDRLTALLFEPIKQNLKRDLKKWEDKSLKNKEIAIAGWEKRKNANASERIKLDANDADIDKVTDKDNVKDKVKVKDNNKTSVPKMALVDYQPCLDFWLKEFHPDWTFGGMQGKALKSLIKKIEKLRKNENDSILELFKIICLRLPDWYKDKDLPIIDSKFNEIIEQIKQQNNGKSTSKPNELSKGQHTINTINELIRDVGAE